MFFIRKIQSKNHESVAKSIKKDLASAFQKQGININRIHIGIEAGSMNIEVLIGEKYRNAVAK